MLVKTELSHLELEILEKILDNEIIGERRNETDYRTVAYIVWIDNGRIEFGRVRWGCRKNIHTENGVFDSWSASPFPGAWVDVPITKIVRVSHVKAF